MMNKLLFTLLFSSSLLFAQQKFIVEYAQNNQNNPEKEREQEIEIQKKYPGTSMKLGGFVTQYYQLEYNNGKSNYSQIETINNSQENGGSNFAISISIGGEYKALVGDQTSKAFKQGVKLDNENYIVNIPFQDYEWKISNEESTILDYKVIKAISEKENIIAWFAPDIKVNLGPNQINGLPGLILKSETQLKNKLETKLIFEATKANLNPKKFTKEKPMKGKEIAQEEFKKLQEESNEKMKQSFSSEGVKTKID